MSAAPEAQRVGLPPLVNPRRFPVYAPAQRHEPESVMQRRGSEQAVDGRDGPANLGEESPPPISDVA